MKPLMEKIAGAIKTVRLRQGLSQEALAERSGLDRTYISGIERCTRNISINSLEKIIVQGLQITTLEFFTFVENRDEKIQNQ